MSIKFLSSIQEYFATGTRAVEHAMINDHSDDATQPQPQQSKDATSADQGEFLSKGKPSNGAFASNGANNENDEDDIEESTFPNVHKSYHALSRSNLSGAAIIDDSHQPNGDSNENSDTRPCTSASETTNVHCDSSCCGKRNKSRKSVKFPADDDSLVTGFMEHRHPFSVKIPQSDNLDVLLAYQLSCKQHRVQPNSKVENQIMVRKTKLKV